MANAKVIVIPEGKICDYVAVILWAVGYLVFTGSRLPSVSTEEATEEITTDETDPYERSVTDEEATHTNDP